MDVAVSTELTLWTSRRPSSSHGAWPHAKPAHTDVAVVWAQLRPAGCKHRGHPVVCREPNSCTRPQGGLEAMALWCFGDGNLGMRSRKDLTARREGECPSLPVGCLPGSSYSIQSHLWTQETAAGFWDGSQRASGWGTGWVDGCPQSSSFRSTFVRGVFHSRHVFWVGVVAGGGCCLPVLSQQTASEWTWSTLLSL